MTNIFQRYGDRNNLNFALPREGIWLGWPSKFKSAHVMVIPPYLTAGQFDVLCNHARYDHVEMKKTLRENVHFFTILRDPVTHFESVFDYMDMNSVLHIPNDTRTAMEVFLNNPREFLTPNHSSDYRYILAQNGMFYDLGYSFDENSADDDIKSAIQRLNREFSLVLMTEYFDESLVLLKRLMNWTTDDVVYFKLNQRRARVEITNEQWIKKIREWNGADHQLYEFFNASFWRKISQQNQHQFKREIAELRRRRAELQEKCVTMTKGRWNTIQYNLKENVEPELLDLCHRMKFTVPEYTNYLRIKSLLPAEIFKGTDMSKSLLRASRRGYAGYRQLLSCLTREQRSVFINNIRKMKQLQIKSRRMVTRSRVARLRTSRTRGTGPQRNLTRTSAHTSRVTLLSATRVNISRDLSKMKSEQHEQEAIKNSGHLN